MDRPRYQPLDRFWPYADLPEQPDLEELAALDPDLREALFGRTGQPFSYTIVFPRFEGAAFTRACEVAHAAAEYRESGEGESFRIRARFEPSDVLKIRELFELVGPVEGTEILIDDRPVPFARELWLPLLWYLLPR
jgi:hypothetical protein